MDECLNGHQNYNELLSEAEWRPNRLLDVGDFTGDTAMVRVVTTTETQPSGHYMTLSRYWGRAQFLQLTIDKLRCSASRYTNRDTP